MTSISLQQERSIVTGGATQLYRVANRIVATEGGPPLGLFVNRVGTDVYDHVATVTDIMNYPEDLNDAINRGLDFYRRPDATKDWPALADALHFMSVINEQLTYLIRSYDELEPAFIGSDTHVFHSPTG